MTHHDPDFTLDELNTTDVDVPRALFQQIPKAVRTQSPKPSGCVRKCGVMPKPSWSPVRYQSHFQTHYLSHRTVHAQEPAYE